MSLRKAGLVGGRVGTAGARIQGPRRRPPRLPGFLGSWRRRGLGTQTPESLEEGAGGLGAGTPEEERPGTPPGFQRRREMGPG